MSEAEEIFLAAADLPLSERGEYLARHCRTEAVRREVESLLAHDEGAGAYLDRAVGQAALALERASQPERVGPWKVGALIGQGGMGSVYAAEREDPEFRQRAAIKILARKKTNFARERNILARLSHPHIAALYDAGLTPGGQPYLVLEYVDGLPIDQYCAERRLGLREKLELFCRVAGAVEYAHRQLVVHRDLKPGNILVTRDGTPKLLDFGIAQVLEEEAGSTATLAMTLEYASPEQTRGEAAAPAMDIYGLGAVLYRLLAGRAPLELGQLPLEQALRRLQEEEVRAPAELPLDLARIVEKSLAKEVKRRYLSVESFRRDVERYLRREPVEARGTSTWYRMARFAQRRWLPLTAAAAVFAALVGGLVVSQRSLEVAQRERAAALEARHLAEAERRRAEQMTEEARAQKVLAERRALELAEQNARADRNLLASRRNSLAVTRMLDQQFLAGGGRQALATVEEWLKVQRGVVEREPGNAEALKLLGILEGRRCGFVAAENVKEARAACERSVSILGPLAGGEQDDEWLRTALGDSQAMLGKLRGGAGEVAPGLELLGEARKNLQRARSGNPGDLNLLAHEATVNLYRADVLLAAGRQTEAAEAFGAAVGVLRNAKGVGLNRALYLQLATASSRLAKMMGEKRPLEAKRLYAESLEVYRQLAEAGGSAMIDWNEYANAMNECPYPELRKPAEAVRYAGKAVEATKGRNPSALDTLAWAYHWAGQREEAVATQRKALALLPAGKSPFRELLEKGLAEFEKAK